MAASSTNFNGRIRSSLLLIALLTCGGIPHHFQQGVEAQGPARRPAATATRNRLSTDKQPAILKDSFYEDSNFVVRIRTTYNQTSSITCNAVLMEEQLVLSDVTCIKYQGMANIDAKFVHVLAGEQNNETVYEVDQIYINKADPRDASTELALLRLSRPLKADTQCRHLIRPERNHSIELETAVRVIGYTNWFDLKENRSRVAKKNPTSKFICTTPGELNETPGSYLLKGAPLLHMVDCRQYQLIGILTKIDTVVDSPLPGVKKQQDCYVQVSSQIKWYEQVRQLTILNAKNDGSSAPSVITVTVDGPEESSS